MKRSLILRFFAFLLARRERARFEGEIALLYFFLYGFGRYLIEFLREPGWMWLGLTANQWLSAAMILVAFILFRSADARFPRRHGEEPLYGIHVEAADVLRRLDIFLAEKMSSQHSRAHLQKMIKNGGVLVDGKNVTPHYRVRKARGSR